MSNDWNNNIMAEFRANGGKVGGMFEGAPLVILHTTGAKSGNEHQTPLMALPQDDNYVVFASMGGAPKHPAWYHNIVANPDVKFEVGTETIEATAVVADRETRDKLYAQQATLYPQFAEYEQKTDRVIPVIILQPKK